MGDAMKAEYMRPETRNAPSQIYTRYCSWGKKAKKLSPIGIGVRGFAELSMMVYKPIKPGIWYTSFTSQSSY